MRTLSMSEAQFGQWLKQTALIFNWRPYHTRDSRRSDAGFFDWTLARPPEWIEAEIKVPPRRPTIAQWEWACVAAQCRPIEVYIWYPRHRELIERRLCGRMGCLRCINGMGESLERQRFHKTDPREAWVCRDCGRVYGEVM